MYVFATVKDPAALGNGKCGWPVQCTESAVLQRGEGRVLGITQLSEASSCVFHRCPGDSHCVAMGELA